MNHQRHIIREAIVAMLAAGSTAASTRVYDTPYDPRTVFPALVVEDDGEAQDPTTYGNGQANREVERTLRITINAEVQQATNYARQRDQLLADVEALMATATLPGVKTITPAGYKPDFAYSGDLPIALGRQRFDITYRTTQGNPAVSY